MKAKAGEDEEKEVMEEKFVKMYFFILLSSILQQTANKHITSLNGMLAQ
jgi:hypothetical protein